MTGHKSPILRERLREFQKKHTSPQTISSVLRTKQTPPKSKWLRRWWPALPLPILITLAFVARLSPALTERLYSSGLYRVFGHTVGRAVSLIPFSLAECVIVALLACIPVAAVWGGILWRKKGRAHTVKLLRRALCLLLCAGCLWLDLFLLLGGYNYYRPDYTQLSGLELHPAETAELGALCVELAQTASTLRANLPEDAAGVMHTERSFHEQARVARDAWSTMSVRDAALFPDFRILPKPVLNSWWMSKTQITGIFMPWTFEANINTAAPAYTIPATACHELAHTRGFMREDEANFLAYLACVESGDPVLAYSGVMLALTYSRNRLYEADVELFNQSNAYLSEAVARDLRYNNNYWAQHDGVIATMSDKVNDTYLKVNNQADGVQSYGRMVDLLLADFRARQSKEQ